MLKNLYLNRYYLLGSFWTELRYRYAGTILGFFWFFVSPLIEAAIYVVVFTQLISVRSGGGRGISYVLFLTTGLFPFLAFSQMINRGSNAIRANALYMRRSLVPSEVFIFREAMLASATLMVYLVLLVPISILSDNPVRITAAMMPVYAILLMVLGFGIALPLANLRILFPDLGEIISVLLQLWRWTLPIMYSDENFPALLRTLMSLNPPYYFIRAFRDALIDARLPSLQGWAFMAFWIVVTLTIAQVTARRLRPEVRDLL